VDLRVAAEPCELALCIAARGLLNRGFSFFELHFTVEDGAQFAVADEIERLRVRRQAAGDEIARDKTTTRRAPKAQRQ